MEPARPSEVQPAVLVVDDDPDICQALQDLLEYEGFSTTVVHTGIEAVAQVGHRLFGAVLLDLGLPDRDGLEVLGQIHHLHSALPIIVLTAFTATERTVDTLDHGAFAYLTKPYRRAELLATLRRAVSVQALAVQAVAAEHARVESDARFDTLVANLPGVVYRCACDPDWTMAFLSDGIKDLSGHPASDFLRNNRRTFASLIHPDDRALVERTVFDAVGRQVPYALEYRILHADGSVRWVMERGRGLFGADGAVAWLDGVMLDITERKQAEATLRQAEERLALAVEGSSDGLWDGRPLAEEPWWSPRTPVWWSPRFKELLGFRSDEFPDILESWAARLHPEDKERVFEALTGHIERRLPYDVEYRLRTKRGEYRWFRARGQAVWDRDGRLVRMAGSLQDIHDRVFAKEALRQSEERFRALYEDHPSMFFTVTRDGTVLSVNRFGARRLGYAVEELVGKSLLAVFHPGDQPAVRPALATCFMTPAQVHHWEFRKVRKDGGVIWVKETVRVVREPEGQEIALVVCEDITDRKQAEFGLIEMRERLELALKAAKVGIWDWDLPANHVYWSDNVEALIGLAKGSFRGAYEAFLESVHPDDRDLVHDAVKQALDGREGYEVEHRVTWPDGSVRWMLCKGEVLRDADGNPVRMLGTVQDLTERKRCADG